MISSTSSSDRAARPDQVSPAGTPAARQRPRLDRISIESGAFLASELGRQPEIRPEVVAQARALADDPNYPPAAVIKHVAQQIVASPDLSEDES